MKPMERLESPMKLNLGCGTKRLPGYTNVDYRESVNPDIAANIEDASFWNEYADNSIDEIYAEHLLEHLSNLTYVLQQVHRTLKPSGTFHFFVPPYTLSSMHPYHFRGFARGFLSHIRHYNPEIRFSNIVPPRFNYTRMTKRRELDTEYGGGLKVFFMSLIRTPINFLANLSPALCERVWCYWVGGFEEIEFRVQKEVTEDAR